MGTKIKSALTVAGAVVVGLVFNQIAIAVAGGKATNSTGSCVDSRVGNTASKDHGDSRRKCPKDGEQANASTVRSAILRVDYDSNEPYGPGVYNAQRSRGVESVIRVQPDGYPAGYCVKINFDARYISIGSVYSVHSSDAEEAQITRDTCSLGYDYFAWGTAAQSIFFTE